MRVVLIQPKRYETSSATASFPPLALYFLYLALEKHTNCRMTIIDCELAEYASRSYDELLRDHPADVYMLTTTTLSRFQAVKLIRQIKHTYPHSLVLGGGPHFSNCVGDTLRHVPDLDAVVRGEGEVTAVQFVNAVEQGQTWEDLPGISFCKGTEVIHNAPQVAYQDLDELGSLADIRDPRYSNVVVSYPDEDVPAASIMTSRGCPHNCVFCSMAARRIRYRDPSRVVSEMQYVGERYGIRGFNFFDASFTGNRQHARSICHEIIAGKLKIRWWAESRVDIPLEMLELMAEAGCVSVQIGVESGSDRTLKAINKRITRDQVIAFCERCNRLGIYVKPLYMLSLPGETFIDALHTLLLSKSLARLPYVLPAPMSLTHIYPGTALDTLARKGGVLPVDFHWYQHLDGMQRATQRLGFPEGHGEDVPIFTDVMGPRQLATMMWLDRTFKGGLLGAAKRSVNWLVGRRMVELTKRIVDASGIRRQRDHVVESA